MAKKIEVKVSRDEIKTNKKLEKIFDFFIPLTSFSIRWSF